MIKLSVDKQTLCIIVGQMPHCGKLLGHFTIRMKVQSAVELLLRALKMAILLKDFAVFHKIKDPKAENGRRCGEKRKKEKGKDISQLSNINTFPFSDERGA